MRDKQTTRGKNEREAGRTRKEKKDAREEMKKEQRNERKKRKGEERKNAKNKEEQMEFFSFILSLL